MTTLIRKVADSKLALVATIATSFALVWMALTPRLHAYHFNGFGYNGPKGCIIPSGLDTYVQVTSVIWSLVFTAVIGLIVVAITGRDEFLQRFEPSRGAE